MNNLIEESPWAFWLLIMGALIGIVIGFLMSSEINSFFRLIPICLFEGIFGFIGGIIGLFIDGTNEKRSNSKVFFN